MERRTILVEPSELENKWGNHLARHAGIMHKNIDARKKAESEEARFKEEYSQLYKSDLSDKEKEDKIFDLIEKYYPGISRWH